MRACDRLRNSCLHHPLQQAHCNVKTTISVKVKRPVLWVRYIMEPPSLLHIKMEFRTAKKEKEAVSRPTGAKRLEYQYRIWMQGAYM